MITTLLAAEGVAKLGAALGAGLAAIGAGYGSSARSNEQTVHEHDCGRCSYRGCCPVRSRYRIPLYLIYQTLSIGKM